MDLLQAPRRVLQNGERLRLDESSDAAFYAHPRLMHHADVAWREQLTELYRRHLRRADGAAGVIHVLDLGGSWDSYLPPGYPLVVTGVGMNAQELAANPALTDSWVQDLNQDPQLRRLPRASIDVALCSCSFAYFTHPEAVLASVARVLRPGGVCIVAFSDACWADKAIAGWLQRDMPERAALVQRCLEAAGYSDTVVHGDPQPMRQPPPSPSAAPASGAAAAGAAGAEGSQSRSSDGAALPLADTFVAVVGTLGEAPPLPALARVEPADVAAALVDQPAMAGLDQAAAAAASGGAEASEALLERWRAAYRAAASDAEALGIPASAIPDLPPGAGAAQISAARAHIAAMVASFLSAGL